MVAITFIYYVFVYEPRRGEGAGKGISPRAEPPLKSRADRLSRGCLNAQVYKNYPVI
jgi:hypothetical protein